MPYIQDDYEIAHFMSRYEYSKSMKTYRVYTTNEDKWLPIHCPIFFSSTYLLDDCLALQDMMQPIPCFIFQSYEHLGVNCHMKERFEKCTNQHKPHPNLPS